MKTKIFSALLLACLVSLQTKAEVVLLDKDDWKISTTGFVELDGIYDSKKGFTESPGNKPVSQLTYNDHTPTTQFSTRNSRLGFSFTAPTKDEFKSRGYAEMDFLGYDPEPQGPAGGSNSEASFFNNAALRIRHMYLATEKNGWQILAGQTWSLVGWQSFFVPTTISIAAISGTLFERTPQFNVMKTIDSTAEQKWQFAVALSRPTQRDGGTPNLDAGIKWSHAGRKAGLNGTYADSKAQPLTVALSGSLRRIRVPSTTMDSQTTYNGGVVVADIMIPLIASNDGTSTSNTLALTGEFSAGRGSADLFPGWSGNLSAFSNSGTIAGTPNLDAGIGGFDSSGFALLNLTSWNAQLQYHLPENWDSFVDVGYARLHSSNVNQYSKTAAGASNVGAGLTAYDTSETTFVNIMHDCTKQIRVGAELDFFKTHYVNDTTASDRRIMFASYFRF